MKKVLLLLLAVIAVCATSAAATTTIDLTFSSNFGSDWESGYTDHSYETAGANINFTSFNKQTSTITDVPVTKNGNVVISLKNNDTFKEITFTLKKWGSKAKTAKLLYSKNGTSFSEFSPAITSSNFSISASSIPEGTTAIKLDLSNNSNQVGVVSIEYEVNGGATSDKTASEIAFEQSEYTATLNQDFVSPTATITAGDGDVTYSSSNTNVATVDETTGVVTLVAEGTTTITATISETETYAKATATYTLTVVDGREAATISFAETSFTANLGETFTAPTPTVTPEVAVVAYSSSKPEVATVDASTGVVTLVAGGKTTITASIAETETYKGATASYELTVVDPNAPEAEKYVLVTDASTLVNGQKIIIVSNNKALSKTQNNNNRGATDVTIADGGIVPGDDVQIITLETTEGGYAFNVGTGYLYAASSSSNYLKTQTKLDDNGKATISIVSSGNATIKFTGSNTRNLLKYNSGSKIFSCYASGQQNVQIYALPAQSIDPVDPVDPDALAAPTFSESWDKVTISAEEGATIYYTIHESWDETEQADPTTESTVYTEPIEFYGPFTIKAIAVKDGETSAVASYDVNTYVFEDLSSLSMITEEWKAYKFVFNCQLTVLYQDAAKKNLYVSNSFSNMLIYSGDQAAYTPGDVINGVCATVNYYNGLQEFLPTAFGEVRAAAGTVRQPFEITYENVAENYMHQYVTLPDVTIKSISGKDNKNIKVADAEGNEVTIYNQFSINNPTVGAKYDVTGFVGVFGTTYQIYPTEFTSYTGAISLGDAYSYNEYSKANVLTFAATISKNGTPIDNDEKPNYEVLLDGVSLGHAGEVISHFAYNKEGKFSLKNGDRTIALDVEWPALDEVEPTITGAKYITYSDNADRTDVKYYIAPSENTGSYSWLVVSTDENAIVGWEEGAESQAFCLYENATPETINVKIAFPFAVKKSANGIVPLAEGEEYDIVIYEQAEAAALSTANFAKDESNTEVSGVADVAVDQNAAAEYYNLQGVRVNGDLTPGLYIRRQGNQATKVVVR